MDSRTSKTAWMRTPNIVATNNADDNASPAPEMSCLRILSATKLHTIRIMSGIRCFNRSIGFAARRMRQAEAIYLTVVMVIAVKMYVNKLKISIVGPRAASSSVPVNYSAAKRLLDLR